MDEENIYEEIEKEQLMNNNYGNNKNKTLIILVILILICIIAIIIYIMNFPKKKNIDTDTEVTTDTSNTDTYQVEFDCDDTCTYDVDLNGNTVKITYDRIQNEDYTYLDKITIGTKIVYSNTALCGGPATLSTLDDVILISYHDGCDIGGNTLYAYTKDGEEIFNYEYLSDSLNMWMSSTSYSIKDNKVIVDATRLYYNNTLRLDNIKEVNICNKDEWDLYEIDETTIVSGTYEIEYIGDNQFKTPNLISKKLLKNVLNNC